MIGAQEMADIFISYRRDDTAGWAGRLAADMRREFPKCEVFQDIASIEIGEDFVEPMRRSLASCAAVIIMIGPRWLKIADERGRRRLDDPEDWVRLEVIESLQRAGLRIMPVLVGNATMPKAADLPAPLKPLATINAHEITDKRWEYDVSQLVAALKKIKSLGSVSKRAPARSKPTPTAKARASKSVGARRAELKPGTVFRDAPDAPEMVVIPAGSFLMGSAKDAKLRAPNEWPQHQVTISRPFAVGKYEVTFDEWDACVVAGGHQYQPANEGWGRGRRPVIHVSWDDAQAYVKWLSKKTGHGYRLLSEAEWEYSARAGTTTCYPWGEEPGINRANFWESGSQWSSQTAPVGSFEPNHFGLYDMIGNVWEWVQDYWNQNYQYFKVKGGLTDGSPWLGRDQHQLGNMRVVRGGSWSGPADYTRVAIRDSNRHDYRSYNLGFRVARTL
jgi:formylglycine-generating enzyme required for sulfatase activity